MFDDVRFDVSQNQTFYALNEEEGDYNSGAVLEGGNIGHIRNAITLARGQGLGRIVQLAIGFGLGAIVCWAKIEHALHLGERRPSARGVASEALLAYPRPP